MRIRLIRHATLQIELTGQTLLFDPMLAQPRVYPSLTLGASAGRNPLLPLPCPVHTLTQPDAIMVTHNHFDHFDRVAARRLPKAIPLFCQPPDQAKFLKHGFKNITPIDNTPVDWNGVQISRTYGRHGRGLIRQAMGATSGFIIQAPDEPKLYIAGDTIWCAEVRTAIDTHRPDIIVVNAGAAQFNFGTLITMTAEDIIQVCKAAPDAKVIAVHMEAINHCRLTRQTLADRVEKASQVIIPQDGEIVSC